MVLRPRPVIARTVGMRSKACLGSAKIDSGFGFRAMQSSVSVVRSAGTKKESCPPQMGNERLSFQSAELMSYAVPVKPA